MTLILTAFTVTFNKTNYLFQKSKKNNFKCKICFCEQVLQTLIF